ncbi:MAG: hypothetical protein NVS9B5_02930 [Terriglobales bacterium]
MRYLALVFAVSFARLALAQVSYEGQLVSSVSLIANPHLDVEKYRALIKQKSGQPYSAKDVEASIEALQQTQGFSKIETEVTPEPAGLRLSFILEPAYYVGVLDFPGATKVFTYTRLLQIANLPDEEAFDKSRIPQIDAALLQFFGSDGYFKAEVQPEVQLDDTNQLANVIFHVALGKRAKIGQVTIVGPPPAETAKLLQAVHSLRATATGASLKRGKVYTAERMKAATSLLQSFLARQHYLASHIRMNSPQFHPETNRVDLSMNIEVGPTVFVRTTGARLSFLPFVSNRQIRKLIPIYEEETVDRDLVAEGQRDLSDYFREKGYFDAKVTTEFKREADKISILYHIDKGKRHTVENITFTGNHHLPNAALMTHVAVRKHHFLSHGQYSEKLVTKSVNNLTAVYRDAGYEQAKVSSRVVDHEPRIDVTFQIDEGPQTLVDNLQVEGNSSIPVDDLTQKKGFGLRSGQPFSPARLSDDRSRILATYLDHGYLNAEVKSDIVRHPDNPHRVDIVYNITENQQVRVSSVVILGRTHTRQSLIKRTADISPQAPLSQGKLLESESQLYDVGVFDWSSVGPRKPITTQTDEEALVKVHEAKRNTITYGIGLQIARRGGNVPSGTVAVPGLPTVGLGNAKIATSENTFVSPRGSIEYTRRNMRGLGETGAISLLVSRLDQRALLTYTDPHLRGTRWSSLFSLSTERTMENPLFAASLGDVSFQLERTINQAKTLTLQVRYDFNKTILSQLLVPELVLPSDRHVRLSYFSSTLIHDTRDKPLDSHSGFYQTLDLRIVPAALGSSVNFSRMLGQFAYYKPVHSLVLANSVRLGLAKPFFGSDVPTSQRFFAGGGTTLRGFPINEAGPQRLVHFCPAGTSSTNCPEITVPVGGDQLFILNSEIRFPLPIISNLGGVVFYDGGNVYSRINFRQFVDHYSNTVGVGLRYSTPVGPVRIDVGRNLNPVTGISATQFFITLGQAF